MHVSGTMTESRLGKQRLFANDEAAYFRDQMYTCGTGDNHPMQTLVLHFTQKEDGNPITIGVACGEAPAQTWFKIDNFRLYATEDEDFVPTRIHAITKAMPVKATEIFDLTGRRIYHMQRGVNIIRMKMDNGTIKTKKIVIK